MSRSLFPGEYDFWERLSPRFVADLKANQPALWRLSGLEKIYGPLEHLILSGHPSDMVSEIAVFLLNALVLDVEARRIAATSGRGVGRPSDVMTPDLAPNLLEYFLRYNDPAGRRSVVVWLEDKKTQTEAGPLFEFFKAAIEPLNCYLIEMKRRPLSPGRLVRYALKDRKQKLAVASMKTDAAAKTASIVGS